MPIHNNDGKDIITVEYGEFDILAFLAHVYPAPYSTLLCFSQGEKMMDSGDADKRVDELATRSIDELPNVKVVLRFTKPEQITDLIRLLTVLQRDVFKYEEWVENPQ